MTYQQRPNTVLLSTVMTIFNRNIQNHVNSIERNVLKKRALISLFSTSRNNIEYKPIVIIGGGPSSLYLSSLLSSSNIPSIVLERKSHKELTTHPQAHYINLRTLEIIRHTHTNLYNSIRNEMPDIKTWEYFRFSYSVLGNRLCNVLHNVDRTNRNKNGSKYSGDVSVISDIACIHLSQNKFWKLLYDTATSYKSDIHLSANVTNIDYNPQEDLFYIRYINNDKEIMIKTNCVIGGDGAHSKIRQQCNIQMNGERSIQTLLNVHFHIKPSSVLYEKSLKDGGMLHFIYNEKLLCVFVCHDVTKGEWVCQIPTFPPLEYDNVNDIKLMILHGLVLGTTDDIKSKYWDSIDICSINTWNMSSLIANQYYRKFGENSHVLLIGDAAHTFPPAGGLGMNTGIQDSHNLFWRLILYHNKYINKANINNQKLFKMYEKERQSIAIQNAKLSNENYQRTIRIVNLVLTGFDSYTNHTNVSTISRSLQDVILSGNNMIPLGIRHKVVDTMYSIALSSLKYLRSDSMYTSRIKYLLHHVLNDKGEGLPLIFPKHELGFTYSNVTTTNNSVDFIPKLQIGSRMPHCIMTLPYPNETKQMFPYLCIADDSITLTDISQQLRHDNNRATFACLLYTNENNDKLLESIKKEIDDIHTVNNVRMNLVHILHPNNDYHNKVNENYIPVIDTNNMFFNLVSSLGMNHHIIVIMRPDGHIMSIKCLSNDKAKKSNILINLLDYCSANGYSCV